MVTEIQETDREVLDFDQAFGDVEFGVSETTVSNAKSNILQPHTPCHC